MTHTEALRIALDALTEIDGAVAALLSSLTYKEPVPESPGEKVRAAIKACKRALSAPAAPEPVAQPVVKPRLTTDTPAAPSVPEGWRLVPVEPTPAMLRAGYEAAVARLLDPAYSNAECNSDEERSAKSYRSDWAAMLAAAPQPGAPTPKGDA